MEQVWRRSISNREKLGGAEVLPLISSQKLTKGTKTEFLTANGAICRKWGTETFSREKRRKSFEPLMEQVWRQSISNPEKLGGAEVLPLISSQKLTKGTKTEF